MPTAPLPVVAADATAVELAEATAGILGARLLALEAWRAGEAELVVWCDREGLAVRGSAASRAGPVRPLPPLRRPGDDLLRRAVGRGRTVIDATGGFAADAGALVAAGCRVQLIERHPLLALLLADAIERWLRAGRLQPGMLTLHHGEARQLLPELRAEVVTLDPMYPLPGGAHAPRKAEGLFLLRQLVGDDDDQGELLAPARRSASARVVVKRPRGAPRLAGLAPSGSLEGRSVRYDLYAKEAWRD